MSSPSLPNLPWFFQGFICATDSDGSATCSVVGRECLIYPQNKYMTNTATASPGWSFLAWEGNLYSNFAFIVLTNNPLALYVDVTKTITAVFGLLLAETTDTPALTWTRGGNLGWYGQTNVTLDPKNGS